MLEYTTETVNATNKVTATTDDPSAVIAIDLDGDPVTNGTSPTWASGDNTLTITVTDGASETEYVVTVRKLSALCAVESSTVPADATIGEDTITADVANAVDTITVDVTVSDDATWKLYSDAECTTEIADKVIALTVGANTAYIEVTAEDELTTAVYTLTVTRAAGE